MMKPSDIANIYSMEDLLPIVAKLAKEFTGNESSSVTYERARQLMEAVLYCMSHFETGDLALSSSNLLPAEEIYRLGLDALIEKVKSTQNKYNRLMEFFDHYGNKNDRDTIEKALPGFFLYYDVKFAPTDHIITMDYPVFKMDMNLQGIDRIRQYIDLIWEEQCYLLQFSRSDIINILRSFHPRYEKEYFNIKEIVAKHPLQFRQRNL